MKKNKRLFILLTLYFSIGQIDAQIPLSFEESLHLLNQGNQSLKIADKSIEIAKAERDKLNAFWYPSLQSTGAFVHMSEKIEVKQPLSQLPIRLKTLYIPLFRMTKSFRLYWIKLGQIPLYFL